MPSAKILHRTRHPCGMSWDAMGRTARARNSAFTTSSGPMQLYHPFDYVKDERPRWAVAFRSWASGQPYKAACPGAVVASSELAYIEPMVVQQGRSRLSIDSQVMRAPEAIFHANRLNEHSPSNSIKRTVSASASTTTESRGGVKCGMRSRSPALRSSRSS